MPQLYAGTSGWAYAGWKPDFYPAKLAQKKFLNYYATQLNTVEVNFTFRQLVKETTLNKWMADTPENFRFAVKAHQRITHVQRLKGGEAFLREFLVSLDPLAKAPLANAPLAKASLAKAGKLGPVLFQLPPNLKFDAGLLREFLGQLPKAMKTAFEFRNATWFVDETWSLLRERNVALCVAGSETLETPDVTTADFAYYRFRKAAYSAQERRVLLKTLRGHTRLGRDVFAYFKHEDTPEGALFARELLVA
jgi:uncharacterized protein YecE (DUF72 family)